MRIISGKNKPLDIPIKNFLQQTIIPFTSTYEINQNLNVLIIIDFQPIPLYTQSELSIEQSENNMVYIYIFILNRLILQMLL